MPSYKKKIMCFSLFQNFVHVIYAILSVACSVLSSQNYFFNFEKNFTLSPLAAVLCPLARQAAVLGSLATAAWLPSLQPNLIVKIYKNFQNISKRIIPHIQEGRNMV